MKIAVIVEKFPSLSETFVLSQITWLLEAGHDVRIFAARRSTGQPVHEDVDRLGLLERTRYARAFGGGHHRRQLQLGTFLLRQVALGRVSPGAVMRGYERSGTRSLPVWTYPRGDASFDVILAHFGPNGVHALEMRHAGVLEGPIVTVFHGYDMNPVSPSVRRGYDRLFEEGDRFLPVSRYFHGRLVEWGAPAERTAVHHMGVDPDRFQPRNRSLRGGGTLRLVSVARLVPKKGLEFSIRAAARLGTAVRYTIIGDGPQRARLESLIQTLGAGNVDLAGWKTQTEVATILDQSHVLLAPSVTTEQGEEEGIPVALMEAMASGLPVIATRHSGIPELVDHEASGFLVEEREVEQMADCIHRLVRHPDQLGPMGRAGRDIVERDFNNHLLHPRLVEFLHAAA
jgi:colanic acid/amylovoran biosynthesis glycosyltransferase